MDVVMLLKLLLLYCLRPFDLLTACSTTQSFGGGGGGTSSAEEKFQGGSRSHSLGIRDLLLLQIEVRIVVSALYHDRREVIVTDEREIVGEFDHDYS